MSEQRAQALRGYFPQVDDKQLTAIFADADTILYTEQEMPRAYQFWNSSLAGIHDPHYNISADGGEPFGNANVEFPWGVAGGTENCKNVGTLRFLSLPKDSSGKRLPIVWFRSARDGQSYRWVYPVETVVGEVLYQIGPDQQGYTFEIRTRTRMADEWEPSVYRPFVNPKQYAQRIKELRPNWQQNQTLTAAIGELENPKILPQTSVADRQPQRVVFRQVAAVDTLPALGDAQLVKELLTTTMFQDISGESWRQSCFAPTSNQEFAIVPAGYRADHIEVSSKSCIRCHESVGVETKAFNGPRDWYGQVRGGDGIFSFHPFDPSCISSNGMGQGVRFRSALSGIFAVYDPQKHPESIYTTIKGLAY